MDWQPISREELEALMAKQLAETAAEQRLRFACVSVPPTKWRLSPWGDLGGGFWVVAVLEDRVLWYNDIEDGFNVSRLTEPGTIPSTEYWCNQSELPWALPSLEGQPEGKLGPPRPIE